jgi:hypothetical protein
LENSWLLVAPLKKKTVAAERPRHAELAQVLIMAGAARLSTQGPTQGPIFGHALVCGGAFLAVPLRPYPTIGPARM